MIGPIPFSDGPGLKTYSRPTDAPWYGSSGRCSICGGEPFPARVRYWDPDDGWRSGVLCIGCAEETAERGPKADDFACMQKRAKDEGPPREVLMDAIADALDGDDDAADVESNELP